MVIRTLLVLVFVGIAANNDVMAQATPWVDLKIRDGHMMLPTTIGGVEGYSILDTGAQMSMINRKFIESNELDFTAGMPIQIQGIHGVATRKTYRDIPVGILGTQMTFQSAVEIDWRDDTQLIIGADFLGLLVFQFDYPNERMRAISRDAIDMKKIKNVESKKDRVTGQPIVKVSLNNEVDVWMVNDTGNAGGVLFKRPIATRRDWLEKYETRQIYGRGVNKAAGMETFRLPVLSIGPFEVKNARAAVPLKGQKFDMLNTSRTMSGKRSKMQGLIGYDVFRNFLVTIDYKIGAMHLEIPQTEGTAGR